jgi:hypothetical protein
MSQISPLPALQGQPAAQVPTTTPAPPTASATAPPEAASNSNQRLMIQESGEVGVFVYTILDRTTGQVINQIPFKAAVDLANHPDYAAGTVISTTA